jgi:hypothetical protein
LEILCPDSFETIAIQLLNSVACPHLPTGKATNKTTITNKGVTSAVCAAAFGQKTGKRGEDVAGLAPNFRLLQVTGTLPVEWLFVVYLTTLSVAHITNRIAISPKVRGQLHLYIWPMGKLDIPWVLNPRPPGRTLSLMCYVQLAYIFYNMPTSSFYMMKIFFCFLKTSFDNIVSIWQ